jgi:hypothetical protein
MHIVYATNYTLLVTLNVMFGPRCRYHNVVVGAISYSMLEILSIVVKK